MLCGRYWIAPQEDNREYAELLRALGHGNEETSWPSGLIVPTLPAPAITQQGIQLMRFGMKKDFLPKILINARSETLVEKSMFKKLFRQGQRCLLPASSFYEPSPDKKGRRFLSKEGRLLFMAALYDITPELPQFVIITRDADAVVAQSHKRMPLLFMSEELQSFWLENEMQAINLLNLKTEANLIELSVV